MYFWKRTLKNTICSLPWKMSRSSNFCINLWTPSKVIVTESLTNTDHYIYLHFCTRVQNRLTAFFQSFLQSSFLKFNIWNSQKRGHERCFLPGILCKQGQHACQKCNLKISFLSPMAQSKTQQKGAQIQSKKVIPLALIVIQIRESANVLHFHLSLHLCSGSPWKFI